MNPAIGDKVVITTLRHLRGRRATITGQWSPTMFQVELDQLWGHVGEIMVRTDEFKVIRRAQQ